ncbi:MAG TPA: dienelactone hydrolase family protein [Anaerovoracaceae bacterium]|nr:dienelactone hydrolase family protein [Anaerovoracaceae bacterium]
MSNAMIILHEIYGINKFIEGQCKKYQKAGFDFFCPDMLGRPPFSYEESAEAYEFFMKNVGFSLYSDICHTVSQLKNEYEKVFIIGFSVGATIAWRCGESTDCDGVIACYGSRIRDYKDLDPKCPTLLLFAKEDTFDVAKLISQLEHKRFVKILKFNAKHGFMDPFSNLFNGLEAKRAEKSIDSFLSPEF